MIIFLFDDALMQCHQIRQIHPLLLTSLKFPKNLYLSSVGLLEKCVSDSRQRLIAAYQISIVPLIAYAKEFNVFLKFFALDVDEYVR